MVRVEQAVEQIKSTLHERVNFDSAAAFRSCDTQISGFFSAVDLRSLMIEYGMH